MMITDVDLYLMSNLSPRKTGLPFIVWISPRGGAKHDVRVKVSLNPKAQPGELIVLPVGHLTLLHRWIKLNRDVLVKFWEGEIEYTEDVLEQLRSL